MENTLLKSLCRGGAQRTQHNSLNFVCTAAHILFCIYVQSDFRKFSSNTKCETRLLLLLFTYIVRAHDAEHAKNN